MTPPDSFDDSRLRYAYRRLVMEGKLSLSLEAARGLVGPDCAYHLYAFLGRHGVLRRQNGQVTRTAPGRKH